MTKKANRKRQFRVEDLEFLMVPDDRIVHRMVHGLPAETFAKLLPYPVPAPWQKPEPALPIDDAVADLLARNRPPRIQGTLEAGTPCPYRAARNGVVRASVSAYLAFGCRGLFAQVGKAADEIGKDLSDGIGALRRLTEHFEMKTDAGRKLDIRGNLQSRAARTNREVSDIRESSLLEALPVLGQAVAALEAVNFHVRARVSEIDTATPNHLQWRSAFIEQLGRTWFSLTGKPPVTGANSPFADFVRAAFVSIGGSDGVPWEHAVRGVIEHVSARPAWDQFDRYAKGHLPPGVEPDTTTEAEKKSRQS